MSLPVPKPLILDCPLASLENAWKSWHRQWKQYLIASGLREKPADVQVATLLTCLGPEAMDILDGLCPTEESPDMAHILATFEEYCVGKPNETYERYKFNTRNQQTTEHIDAYLSALRKLAKTCNYSTLEESLLRDRIVLGIKNDSVRKRLLQEPDLNLSQAVSAVRAHEATSRQMENMTDQSDQAGRNDPMSVQAVKQTGPAPAKFCKFCGRRHPFRKELCPAWGKICQTCRGRNHFSSKCWKSSQVRCVTDQYDEQDDEEESADRPIVLEIRQVESVGNDGRRLWATLVLGENHMQDFLLDTGAGVNLIPQHVYKKASRDPALKKLKRCKTSLVMFNQTQTEVVGKTVLLAFNPKTGKEHSIEFLVVREDYTPLIGAQTLQDMDLITVNSANIATCAQNAPSGEQLKKEEIVNKYASVFTGTGKLDGKLQFSVDENAHPVYMPTRTVPAALQDDVKSELARLVEDGIIAPVTTPTEWTSALVTVKKANGRVRLCLDPKSLNKALKRNRYPLPTIDDLTSELHLVCV